MVAIHPAQRSIGTSFFGNCHPIVTERGQHKGMTRQKIPSIRCPRCNSDALYRFGRTKGGSQRYRCLLCGTQFIKEPKRIRLIDRPICSVCGRKMYLYKRNGEVRFRCSGYPACKTYLKTEKGVWPHDFLHPRDPR